MLFNTVINISFFCKKAVISSINKENQITILIDDLKRVNQIDTKNQIDAKNTQNPKKHST